MAMQSYVLVYVANEEQNDKVLLVQKDRPASQRGRFNLPGGKIEPGEHPRDAAIRELLEETGLKAIPDSVEEMGHYCGTWGFIHAFKLFTETTDLKPRQGETEQPFWTSWEQVKDDRRLMPNLRVSIPFMRAGLMDWRITDEGNSSKKQYHDVGVTIRSTMHPALKGELNA